MKVNIFTENLNTKIYGQNTLLFESLESTNKKMIEDLNSGVKLLWCRHLERAAMAINGNLIII